MSEKTYGRGQIEIALWRSFARASFNRGDIPKVFRTRIKRLMELDSDRDLIVAEELPEADFAFAAPPSAESGEVAYRAVDAFCLAIGLDLLDAGFKQSEVVFLMRYLRLDLEERFPDFLTPLKPNNRQRSRAKNDPDLPSDEDRGVQSADRKVFIVIMKIELTEIIPSSSREKFSGPVFHEPTFCTGIAALGEELNDVMPLRRRAVTVLELASTARAVDAFLKQAPDIRRGRPKTKKARDL